MRILHVIPSLDVGGAETQLGYLAPELAAMGHEVHVVHTQPVERRALAGVALHRLASSGNYDPRLVWRLIRHIRQIRPDVVQTWIVQADIIGGLAAKHTGTPWILREPSCAMAYTRGWKHRARVRVAATAAAIVSNSQGGDEYWRAELPRAPRRVVRNGVPAAAIEAVAPAMPPGMPEPIAPIVLAVARLTFDHSGNKNLAAWLEALAIVRREVDVQALLCGDGPQRHELESGIRRLDLGASVRLTGELSASAIWGLMKKAAMYVSLSEFEGCPNTVMEAMACGCPVVLSDIAAHREIADETCASFADPSDPRDVAASILRLLAGHDAARERARLAKQRCAAWSVAEMARGFERVYESLLQPVGTSAKSCQLS